MKLRFLVYMLSFLALVGTVSAGTYTEVNYNGMFKVAEIKSLNSKFIKNADNDLKEFEPYTVETSFVMNPRAGYQTCYRSNEKGCLTCKSTLLSDGYGEVTNYDGISKARSSCPEMDQINGYSNNAFRDDYTHKSCPNKVKQVNIKTISKENSCRN